MTGREVFSRFGPAIVIIVKVAAFIPWPITRIMLDILSPFGGKISALLRYFILAGKLARCGSNVYFGPRVVLKNPETLSIGDNVSIHDGCYLDAAGGIVLGDNVSIAHHSSLISFNHGYENLEIPIKYNPVSVSPICIDHDVWIGCGCRILAGVNIGSRVIVAAGAVVVGNVEAGSLVAGVPAKVIKRIQ